MARRGTTADIDYTVYESRKHQHCGIFVVAFDMRLITGPLESGVQNNQLFVATNWDTLTCILFNLLLLLSAFSHQGSPQRIFNLQLLLSSASSSFTSTSAMSSFTTSINLLFGLPRFLFPGNSILSILFNNIIIIIIGSTQWCVHTVEHKN